MKALRWSLGLAKPLWPQFSLAAFLGLATVFSGLGLLTTSAFLIASAALQPSIAELQVAIVAVRSLGLARGLLRYAERYLSHSVTFKLLSQIRLWTFSRLEPLSPAVLGEYHSGDVLARVVDDVETMQFFFLRALQPPIIAAAGLSILVGVIAPFNLGLALCWLSLLLAAGLGIPLLTSQLTGRVQQQLLAQRGRIKRQIVEFIQGLPEWLAYGQSRQQHENIQQLTAQLTAHQNQLAWLEGLNQAGLAGLTQLAAIAVLWLLLPQLESERMNGIQLAVLVVASLASFELITPLSSAISALEAGIAAAGRLLELTQQPAAVTDPKSPPPTIELDSACLKIENLHFRYEADEIPALAGLDLTLPAGGTLALVGPSGAGKSTVLNLLLRFWEYQTGTITLGQYELRRLSGVQARSLISVLPQRTTLFSGSLRDNLMLVKPDATESQLLAALNLAGATELMQILPQGLDSEVGEWGVQLSAGQQQRLALARCLLLDRPYLFLDEPTANLDPDSSGAILEATLAGAAEKTVLLISHQLAGLESFDQIAVMAQGRVVQRGRHHQLVRQPGLYRQMWQLQSERRRIESAL